MPQRNADGYLTAYVRRAGRVRRVVLECIVCHELKARYTCAHVLGDDELRLAAAEQTTCDAPLCGVCAVFGSNEDHYCPLHKDEGAQKELFA